MPGGDRTGPLGLGPMTGRAAGYCAGYPVPGYLNPIPGRGWYGAGRGRGFGRGRGWGWRVGYYGYSPYAPAYPQYPPAYPSAYPPAYPEPTAEEEKKFLQDELASLEEEMKAIRERMAELGKQEKQEKKK